MLLLGLDIGTTTIKAAAYDPDAGRVIALAAHPTPTDHPAPGLSEHDPEALWGAVCACLREVTKLARSETGQSNVKLARSETGQSMEVVGVARSETGHSERIAGLAIASLAESGVLVDVAGRALCPIIAWYDRRSEPQATWLHRQIGADEMHVITGQRATASFGICKWLWIREHWPEAAAAMATWLPVPNYILWRLTGARSIDLSQASRMLALDQRRLDWSDRILDTVGLRREQLPRPLPGGTVIGGVTSEAAAQTGLPTGMPCALGGHDHLCAALAVGAYRPGVVADSSGTAQAVLTVVPGFASTPKMAAAGYACYAHVIANRYILKDGLKAAGGAVEWLVRQLAGPGAPADRLPYAALLAMAERGVGVRGGPIWLPHLIDSGTPEGDRHSLAALVGARIEHDAGDLLRGLLESLAFWLRHNLDDVSDLPIWQPIEEVILLGGTTRLALLSQLKADILGRPVIVPELPEAAAIGAALLAGLGTGVFRTPVEAVASLRYGQAVIEPVPAHVAWYDRLYREAYRPLYAALREVNHRLAGF
jgi:xylulokinase